MFWKSKAPVEATQHVAAYSGDATAHGGYGDLA